MSGTKKTLFRAASLQHRQTAWLGRPTIALGLPVTLATLTSLVLAVALAALVSFGSYTRRVDLSGIMLPQAGIASVAAPESGAIRALAVKEGDNVREADLLYTIDVDTGIKEGGAQQAVISALMVQRHMLADAIERKQAMAANTQQQLTQTIANLEAQLTQLAQQIGMQESFEERLKTEYQQYLAAFNRHTVPAAIRFPAQGTRGRHAGGYRNPFWHALPAPARDPSGVELLVRAGTVRLSPYPPAESHR